MPDAILSDQSLKKGVNTYKGHITYPAVAQAFNLDYVPIEKLL